VLHLVKRQGWGESCSIRLWEREAYVLMEHALVLRGKCVRANMRWNLEQTVPARAGDPTADTPHIRQPVKPVKTRWNSYLSTFVRAAELHGPIDSYSY
jgi:hypothetical protein